MKVLVKRAGSKKFEIKEIEPTLKSYQSLVGGYIEVIYLKEDLCFVCNEEGKVLGLPENFCMVDEEYDTLVDRVHGDAFFCKVNGDDFSDITEEQEHKVKSSFLEGERFSVDKYFDDYFYI